MCCVIIIIVGVTLFPVTNPQTEGVANGGTGFNTEQVVLIAAVGGALLLIAAVFIVVIAAVCGYRKRGNELLIHAIGTVSYE